MKPMKMVQLQDYRISTLHVFLLVDALVAEQLESANAQSVVDVVVSLSLFNGRTQVLHRHFLPK